LKNDYPLALLPEVVLEEPLVLVLRSALDDPAVEVLAVEKAGSTVVVMSFTDGLLQRLRLRDFTGPGLGVLSGHD